MDAAKKRRLEAKGWKVGSADEFLGLTAGESALVDARIAVGELVREKRTAANLSQHELAKQIGSGQGRVSRIEAADPSVSFELLFRAAIAAGASRRAIGDAIAGVESRVATRARRAPAAGKRVAKKAAKDKGPALHSRVR